MSFNRGSEWHKWDLHVHTPYTFMNSYDCTDEEFIDELLKKEISAIGLTNYFKFKNEEYYLRDKLKDKGIQVFLNLEVRLDYQNKDNNCLDLHIIFSEDIVKENIDKLLQNVTANVQGNKKKLIDLKTQDDFKFAIVNFDKLQEQLNDESLKLKGKYLLCFLSRGKGNGRTSSSYEKLAKETDFLIHSSDNENNIEQDRAFWLTHNKVVVQSSDAHSMDTIGSRFTWIKANLTFEGLKQITYEPTRVFIGKNKPQEALHKIEEVKLLFNADTKWENDKFCFANFNETINFSPFLTCIVGGRGSGKSTLLNLIAEKIDKANKDFFAELNPSEVKSKVLFLPEEIENIEFLAQNKIEEFAKDSKKFTKAIFDRLDKKANGKLNYIEKNIKIKLEIFDNQITLLEKRVSLHRELKDKKKDLKKYEGIVKTLTDTQYLQNKDELQKIQKQIIDLTNSRIL